MTFATDIPDPEPQRLQPKIVVSDESESYGRFVIEPLAQGFGVTLGNALRRVLLNALPGTAITSVRIDGVDHEYSTLKNVQEDMIDFLLNVKGIRLKSISGNAGSLRLEVKDRAGLITAGDLEPNGDVEIVNPEHPLLNLDNNKAKISMEFSFESGTGFIPADDQNSEIIGILPVDAIFTPIKRSNFQVEATRVGQVTDYDRLILEIWTDGTMSAEDAVKQSAAIMVDQLGPFVSLGLPQPEEEEEEEESDILPPGMGGLLIEDMKLSSRTQNSLRRGNLTMLGEVLEHSPEELLALRNFGDRSLQELIGKLKELGVPVIDGATTRGWRKKRFIELFTQEDDDEDQTLDDKISMEPAGVVYSTGGDDEEEEVDISSFSTRSFAPDDESGESE